MLNVEIGIMCRDAHVSRDKYEWTLSIRKNDDSEVGDIAKKHKSQIDSEYLRDYLPGWENIEWKRLKTPPKFPKELSADCGSYKLTIILADKNKSEDITIINEFQGFMQL